MLCCFCLILNGCADGFVCQLVLLSLLSWRGEGTPHCGSKYTANTVLSCFVSCSSVFACAGGFSGSGELSAPRYVVDEAGNLLYEYDSTYIENRWGVVGARATN
jgi:hypothetical protein